MNARALRKAPALLRQPKRALRMTFDPTGRALAQDCLYLPVGGSQNPMTNRCCRRFDGRVFDQHRDLALDNRQSSNRRRSVGLNQNLGKLQIRPPQKIKGDQIRNFALDRAQSVHATTPAASRIISVKNVLFSHNFRRVNFASRRRICSRSYIGEPHLCPDQTEFAAIDAAERCGACERHWHSDGTEMAPKLERGWMLVPVGMVARRRVAADLFRALA